MRARNNRVGPTSQPGRGTTNRTPQLPSAMTRLFGGGGSSQISPDPATVPALLRGSPRGGGGSSQIAPAPRGPPPSVPPPSGLSPSVPSPSVPSPSVPPPSGLSPLNVLARQNSVGPETNDETTNPVQPLGIIMPTTADRNAFITQLEVQTQNALTQAQSSINAAAQLTQTNLRELQLQRQDGGFPRSSRVNDNQSQRDSSVYSSTLSSGLSSVSTD